MRAPAFWWKDEPTPTARLLSPLGAIYGALTARRMNRAGADCGPPVICIGNFVAGGAGKTPTAIAVAQALLGLGRMPIFLSRGYGSAAGAPRLVNRARDKAADVGDEPLLLAGVAPCIVAADKMEGARACAAAGADAIVMDDGLQNPALNKALRIAVVDGAVGVGNGLCVPAGPLRAPLAAQWPHVDALVVIGEGAPGEAIARAAQALGKPVLRGLLAPEPGMAMGLSGREVIAFAGIGRPEKFFDTLRALGAEIIETEAFPDHHAFTAREIAGLQARAKRRGAALVTTEKDAVRLGSAAEQLLTLPVRLALEDEAGLLELLGRLRA
jgi:tetraacyldisaccharide 4'-kinase